MAIEPPLGKFGELEGNRSNANEGEKSGVTHGRQEERLTAEKGLSEKIDAGSDGSIRNATYEVDLAENGVNLSQYRIVDGKEELVAKEGGSEKRIGNGSMDRNELKPVASNRARKRRLRGPGDRGAVPEIVKQLRRSRGRLTIKEGERT
ncbi:hypothetical protein DY000_02039865 [Brassica cretica]|uniref:AT-hook motif nuclear-localized protein n=1 Tax=Brassica cretica TaxID=69181 RepID=A0ABQ7B970_BRACR|nr:hypothetical protein DY000_02039865 [Brassica cretica]